MSTKWNYIEVFSLQSATGNNNVYANGLQSIKLRLAIKVLDDNNRPVILSEAERLTITLVNYHGGAEIKYRAPDDSSPLDISQGEWDWSTANIGDYSYFPSASSRLQVEADSASGITYMDCYVRTLSKLPATLSVRITRADGQQFESDELNSGRIELKPVAPPVYDVSSYQLFKTVIKPWPSDLTGLKGLVALNYFRFGLVVGGESLRFKSVTLSPGGLYGQPIGAAYETSLVGFSTPGNRDITYLYQQSKLPVTLNLVPDAGQIYFVEAGLVDSASVEVYKAAEGKVTTECLVSAVDVYGNPHHLNMRFIHGLLGQDPQFY